MLKYKGNDYYHHTTNHIFEIIECCNCGLEQIYPLPSKKEQLNFYPKTYYSYNKTIHGQSIFGKIGQKIFSIFINKRFEIPEYKGEGKNFLDIGCGDGFVLDIIKRIGGRNKIEGFEISDKKKKENNIYYGESITDTKFDTKYDIIRCRHVFEHIDNPIDFLEKVNKLLTNNGLFILTLPNVSCFMSKIFGPYASDRDIPRHLFGYNYKNIQTLLINSGFKIIGKKKKRQINDELSIIWFFNDKFKRNIEGTILIRIISALLIPIDFLLTLFGNTNQMSFILAKGENNT